MRVKYWKLPETEEENNLEQREDGKVLKCENIKDFIAREMYGNPKQYTGNARAEQYLVLSTFELAYAYSELPGKKAYLVELLSKMHKIRRPFTPIPDYKNIIEEVKKDEIWKKT